MSAIICSMAEYELARRLAEAHSQGSISERSLNALQRYAEGRGAKEDMGTHAKTIQGEYGMLATMLADDSGSIDKDVYVTEEVDVVVNNKPQTGFGMILRPFSGMAARTEKKIISQYVNNIDGVIAGQNAALDGLAEDPFFVNALAHTRLLNGNHIIGGKVVSPYRPLREAVRLSRDNFRAHGGTPLYDETVATLAQVVAKVTEFEAHFKEAYTATLLITDGGDAGSFEQTPETVKPIIEDMTNSGVHIVAAMGIPDGHTDFKRVFMNMGIGEQWIMTPQNSPREIAECMKKFGRVVAKANREAKAGKFQLFLTDGLKSIE